MSKFLLKNCDIANFETLGYDRKDILINQDKIEKIANNIVDLEATVIDVNGKMVMPAFVDCHTHMHQTFLKGYMDDFDITEWLVRMFGACDLMTDEEFYYSCLVGMITSMRFGTTTINDMGDKNRVAILAQAAEDAGIRVIMGVGHNDIAENEKTPVMTIDQCLRECEDIYQKYNGKNGDMLRTSVSPAGLPAGSKELFQALKKFANERGLIFHTHLAEGKKETYDVRARTGFWEGEALYEYGILDENTILAHSIWLEDFELDLIAKSKANPAHCPNTNMKISDGIPKIQKMLERGINVCMGCDGEASSSTRDIVREAKAGAYLQKAITLNPKAMDITNTYKMMTSNGAKALSFDNLGEIKEGNKADLIVVNMENDISIVNNATRLSNLLYAGTGHAVDTVFANGKLVVSGGVYVKLDIGNVIEKSERILKKFNQRLVENGFANRG